MSDNEDRIAATVEQIDPTKGSVIVLRGWDWLGEEVQKLFEALRYAWGPEEAERARVTVIALDGDATIESLDDEGMRANGWLRAESVRQYLDEAIANWRENRKRTESPTASSLAACYVDAFQSVRDSLLGETLP